MVDQGTKGQKIREWIRKICKNYNYFNLKVPFFYQNTICVKILLNNFYGKYTEKKSDLYFIVKI